MEYKFYTLQTLQIFQCIYHMCHVIEYDLMTLKYINTIPGNITLMIKNDQWILYLQQFWEVAGSPSFGQISYFKTYAIHMFECWKRLSWNWRVLFNGFVVSTRWHWKWIEICTFSKTQSQYLTFAALVTAWVSHICVLLPYTSSVGPISKRAERGPV